SQRSAGPPGGGAPARVASSRRAALPVGGEARAPGRVSRRLTSFSGECTVESVEPPAPGPAPVVPLLPDLAEFAAQRHGSRPFLLSSTPPHWQSLSFVDFAQAVRAFGARLRAEGVAAGDRVGLQSE